ncbi:phasin family protein [Methylobacterium fujisawaense]|uniref:phasin family protein n=1 Tax=Methylobacterium fujisawaense TaxID=107400 RepID=UPI002F35EF2F
MDVPSDPVATAAATTSEAEFEARSEAESGTGAVIDIAPRPVPGAGPGLVAAANRISFTPDRLDVVEIGSIIARYVRGEGEAAVAHLRALSGARSPADVIRLQVGEVQRAADASLTCWVTVVGQASRVVAYR